MTNINVITQVFSSLSNRLRKRGGLTPNEYLLEYYSKGFANVFLPCVHVPNVERQHVQGSSTKRLRVTCILKFEEQEFMQPNTSSL